MAKNEVIGLYDALKRGKIDGSQYQGDCACLVGTIANIRHEKFEDLGINLKPDSTRSSERWFLAIQKGDTPESNPIAKITEEWILEFCKNEGIELPKYKLVSSFDHPEIFK